MASNPSPQSEDCRPEAPQSWVSQAVPWDTRDVWRGVAILGLVLVVAVFSSLLIQKSLMYSILKAPNVLFSQASA